MSTNRLSHLPIRCDIGTRNERLNTVRGEIFRADDRKAAFIFRFNPLWKHEQRRQASPFPSEGVRGGGGDSSEEQDNTDTEGSGFGDQSGITSSQIPIRSRRSSNACGLRSVLLRVRDLDLGYDADETILFKYCGGECPRVRSNHDLTVGTLLLRGALPDLGAGEGWQSGPCCRPTHHEDLAFLDNAHHWHKVEKLSAAACTCVG